jgi:hypothetical protein
MPVVDGPDRFSNFGRANALSTRTWKEISKYRRTYAAAPHLATGSTSLLMKHFVPLLNGEVSSYEIGVATDANADRDIGQLPALVATSGRISQLSVLVFGDLLEYLRTIDEPNVDPSILPVDIFGHISPR